jgi:hypothetical protein
VLHKNIGFGMSIGVLSRRISSKISCGKKKGATCVTVKTVCYPSLFRSS